MTEIMTVCVAVSHTSYSFDQLFTYRVPLHLIDDAEVGKRVVVPFGRNNSKRIGIIFKINSEEYSVVKERSIKPILTIADKKPALNEELCRLAQWLCENTFCTYFEAVQCILPNGMHLQLQEQYLLSEKYDDSLLTDEEKNFLTFLNEAKSPLELDSIVHSHIDSDKKKKKLVSSLLDKGVLVLNCNVKPKSNSKSQKMVRLTREYIENPDAFKITPKQEKIVKLLSLDVSYALNEICYVCGVTSAVAKSLEKNKIVEIYEKRVMRDMSDEIESENIDDIVLSELQENVFNQVKDALYAEKADCFLLHGVTGSGKTSVFKKLINEVITTGKQALLLLPEISLTPQIVNQFRSIWGNIVTVIHSGLSVGQRLDAFDRIEKNEAKIIIGTRSAVFAPAKNIGIIIMDEEGERSYKSDMSPRYNTVDVAKMRIRYHKAVLLLASATPSVESYYLAKKGIYHLLEMKERYSGLSLPEVKIVDMNKERTFGIEMDFGETLVNEVNENLQRCEQSILLLNRRGYHTMVSCVSCGKPVFCPNCSVPMTYHKKNNKLMCHYCLEIADIPEKCPECGEKKLHMVGFGTQKLEEQIQEIFPKARVLRMDADTVFSRDSYENNIKAFENGEYDILVGTQMVGKGLNFPEVTLVGVISVDKSLYAGDFRSFEKTFSLITQVVGRGGRSEKKGRAILQTYLPDHHVIQLAAKQDYESFFENEIKMRKQMIFPPVCDMCVIGISGENESQVSAASAELITYIKNKLSEVDTKKLPMRILGPAPCTFGKINKKYRYRILIKCKNTLAMRSFIRDILVNGTKSKSFSGIGVYADMNGDAGI